MSEIMARFCNGDTEGRLWTILDVGADPNHPPELFSGFLEPGVCTDPVALYSADGTFGHVAWQSPNTPGGEAMVHDGESVGIS